MNLEMPINNPPQKQQEEEEETPAIMNSSNHPPCNTCSCKGLFSFPASASLKRPSSHLPTHEPRPKKPATTTHSHSLSSFSKIPLPVIPNSSFPSQETHPFLRRCSSDPCNPSISTPVEESPHSPPHNAETQWPGTPLSNAIASAKLRKSLSDPTPSPDPAKTITSSSDGMGLSESPNAKWARQMRDCMLEMSRKCEEFLGSEEDTTPTEEIKNNSNNDATLMENSEEEYVEAVVVEKAGECLIIQFKCPCGQGHHIVLSGRNCYYKLM